MLSPHFLVDASFCHALNRILEKPSVNDWQVNDFRVAPRVRTGGLGFYEAGNRSDSWQFQAKATNILNGHGQHQIRCGVDYENLDFSQLQQYSGPACIAPNGQQTATGAVVDILPDTIVGQIYHVSRASLTAARPTTQHYGALFVEDEWKIGNSLTIRPGVRYEQESLSGSIVKNFSLKNNWAPRLGVIWDPSRSGKGKVFANYGRYYARVPSDLAARALSADASITADYFDPNLLSYYNEWVLGTEYSLRRGLDIGVRYVQRNIGRVLEDVQPYPLVAIELGVPGAATANYLLTNPSPNTPVVQIPGSTVGFESPVHNYHAVEFTANKRLSHNWSLISSYRWSKLTGNFEGFFRNDNGQSDPGISSLYDYPTNDPTYTSLPRGSSGSVCASSSSEAAPQTTEAPPR